MIPCNVDEAFCDTAEEGAALGLLGLMTGISERQSRLLKLLSQECDGWWHWTEGIDGVKFIRTEDWLKLFPEKAEGPAEIEGQVRSEAKSAAGISHPQSPYTPEPPKETT